MANMISKMKNILGFGDFDEDFEDDEFEENFQDGSDDEMVVDESIEPVISGKKSNKVVNIHTSASAKVLITKPTAYEEAMEICDAVRNRRIVVVNTTNLDIRTAQRLLDFIGGSCYALHGDIQEIEKRVYLLSPSNVEVTSELKSELTSKALFNWSK
ncbi:cell division protein SepF [Clostridium baratii]|uniref:Cell division protein SepF n=3 Tax=Clostridium TaxID=1485 RepID=A0A0A7FVT1_9CLOT|nr:cell division protein SepF [Clostridium baratii]AIY83050.1 hypothetical protein U729_2863 [Clostridium baratii str. Sullivan]AQM59001.1 cell division protein SepF [Clostridium baratii]KJU71313.1 cell division protein SepF [Clostridium baratii]MBS6006677.1 cell division protein SepF [Clostridium baratii]MBS6042699.1 cell division protein SepF [Clostridium baratii]